MAAPILKTPEFEAELPIAQRTVTYRAFLVNDEKALLMAKESGKEENMVREMRKIVYECTFKDVDPASDSMVDVVYMFLMIRARSAGEVSMLRVPCSCGEGGGGDAEIDLTEMNITIPEVSDEILLGKDANDDDITMKLKPLTFDKFSELDAEGTVTSAESDLNALRASVVDVYNQAGESYDVESWTEKEWENFYCGLSSPVYKKIAEYFGNAPKISLNVECKCDRCKKTIKREVSDLVNFT